MSAGLCRPLIQSIVIRSNDEGPGAQSPERFIASIRDERSPVTSPSDSMLQTKFPSLALVSKDSRYDKAVWPNIIFKVDLSRAQTQSLVASIMYFKRGHQPCRRGYDLQLASGMGYNEWSFGKPQLRSSLHGI